MPGLHAYLWMVIIGFAAFALTLFVVSFWSRGEPGEKPCRSVTAARRPEPGEADPRLDTAA